VPGAAERCCTGTGGCWGWVSVSSLEGAPSCRASGTAPDMVLLGQGARITRQLPGAAGAVAGAGSYWFDQVDAARPATWLGGS
jgi:hypothetical protein